MMTILNRVPEPAHEAVTAFLSRQKKQHLIGGEWCDAVGRRDLLDAFDPASGGVLAHLAHGTSCRCRAAPWRPPAPLSKATAGAA